MRTVEQRPPLAEPKNAGPPLARARRQAPRPPAIDEGYDERMRRALAERATRPVQAKAAVDAGYGDLVAAARAVSSGGCAACSAGAPCATCKKASGSGAGTGAPSSGRPLASGIRQARRATASSDPAEIQADVLGARIGADLAGLTVAPGELSADVRAVAERHVGVSLAGTRLDASPAANERARGLGALAVTEGHTVSFAEGRLSADGGAGGALIGHELVHAAQQVRHASVAVQRAEVRDPGPKDAGPEDAGPEDAESSSDAGRSCTPGESTDDTIARINEILDEGIPAAGGFDYDYPCVIEILRPLDPSTLLDVWYDLASDDRRKLILWTGADQIGLRLRMIDAAVNAIDQISDTTTGQKQNELLENVFSIQADDSTRRTVESYLKAELALYAPMWFAVAAERLVKAGFGLAGGNASGRDPKYDPARWELLKRKLPTHDIPLMLLHVMQGKSRAEAIDAIIEQPHKWNFDCAQPVQVANLYVDSRVLGWTEFDRRHDDIELKALGPHVGPLSGLEIRASYLREGKQMVLQTKGVSDPELPAKASVDELLELIPIGSRVSWRNVFAGEGSDYFNENAVKLARDSYLAHPFGRATRAKIEYNLASQTSEDPSPAYVSNAVFVREVEVYRSPADEAGAKPKPGKDDSYDP